MFKVARKLLTKPQRIRKIIIFQFIPLATTGNSQRTYKRNSFPLDTEFKTKVYTGNEDLVIDIPTIHDGEKLDNDDVKWLSIWCNAFALSFGDLEF